MPQLPWTKLALTIDPPGKNGFRFQRGISFGGECPPGQFCCWSGAGGHSDSGGYFSPGALITDQWHEHVEKADALWLLPLLHRFAAGEPIDAELIATAFHAKHGSELTPDYFDRLL